LPKLEGINPGSKQELVEGAGVMNAPGSIINLLEKLPDEQALNVFKKYGSQFVPE